VSAEHPRVPYITSWSAEAPPPSAIVSSSGGGGIAYADEIVGDRDSLGILWARSPSARGRGTPQFGRIHTARQRRAMRRLLCQVCGGPADRDDEGILWVLKDHRADWPGWPNGMGVTEPPICAPCLAIATRACPALRRGHVVIRARGAEIAGVHGLRYAPGPRGPLPVGASVFSYGSPELAWVQASQLVRELHDTTLITP
jgi:hypothetical protein